MDFGAYFLDAAQQHVNRRGPRIVLDNSLSQEILGIKYRPIRPSIIEMFHSMIELGMVPNNLPKANG
jgi:hypothetical protein